MKLRQGEVLIGQGTPQVDAPAPNQTQINKSKLVKMITDGTYHNSCWMTTAQIEKMKSNKMFFSNLD